MKKIYRCMLTYTYTELNEVMADSPQEAKELIARDLNNDDLFTDAGEVEEITPEESEFFDERDLVEDAK